MDAVVTEAQSENLIRMLQKLLGSHKDDYTEDTILGSDINQIRHLFYNLQSEARNVMLQYSSEIFRARVVAVEGNRAELHIPGFEQETVRRCRIKFEIANILYEFEVAILDFYDEGCEIRIPSFLQSASRRGDRRIYTDDLFMRFITLYRPILGRRGVGQLIESRYQHIVNELQKDEPDLYMINTIADEQIQRLSANFEFRFYKPGEKHSLMEELITETRKTLFIRDTQNLESYFEAHLPYGMINYHAEYSHMMHYDSEDAAAAHFDQVRRQDLNNFLTSYVCAPLLIFDEVVGHIYVARNVFDRLPLDRDEAFHVQLLAQLMSYAMSKTVLSRSYFRHTFTRVINISRSGLLFELNNQIVFDYLTIHDRLKMDFAIRHHQLSFHGEITRYVPTADGFRVGVNFFQGSPDAWLVLENMIYRQSRQVFG
ncbi:MAG: DUF1577 domain-containing protein [Leptospiraceae bacterium]|nr:DUF1577 domain-containing protein [Leptospiraceae bacterium]